ncbi:MAG: hypothetical protein HQ523_09180 [Lentisphaerae bacterium]|nr:hypothetical protein [Lentisphaerota bacterium]
MHSGLQIGGQRVLLGGFHDHWARTGSDSAALLLAAMNYYHYDFICLMDGGPADTAIKAAVEAFSAHMKVYLGRERFFGWGHVLTVNCDAPELPATDPDYRGVLATLKAHSGFMALAHPQYSLTRTRLFETGEIDRLLDDELIDAVQLELSPEELLWLQHRHAAGKRTSLVGGWDMHMIQPVADLPRVLYGPQRRPDGHLDSCGSNRTLVLAEENSLAAIAAAVRQGRSLIENLRTGELLGAPELVQWLETNGYREAITALDRERDQRILRVTQPAVIGQPLALHCSTAGTLRVPGNQEPVELTTDAAGAAVLAALPPVTARDGSHFPVAWAAPGQRERVWAVAVEHPIQLDVLPLIHDNQRAIELVLRRPFHGQVAFAFDGLPPANVSLHGTETSAIVPLPDGAPARLPYQLVARTADGITRTGDGVLTFVCAPRFGGDWSQVPLTAVDAAVFVPALGSTYGAHRPWPGSAVFAARFQVAWTTDALLVRIDVTDKIHFQPNDWRCLFEGDSLQLAIDPLSQREDIEGAIYSFIAALTPAGPELYRWKTPSGEPSVKPNTALGGRGLTATPRDGGMCYQLTLPWSELLPAGAVVGARLGLFLLLSNNDGEGLTDVLHWPQPIPGMWIVPRQWGTVTLTA